MILERLHPRRLGFIGGFLVGFLIALFAFGDLAHFFAFVHPDPASAQTASAPAVRIMDGAHVQLATVSHTGRLLVDTGSTSGLTDHITSVTHVSGAVMIRNTVGTVATLTGTALDVNCTGCAAASVVEVDHVSSVTHVVGSVMLRSQAGTAVTVTGTALDVNCTGCAAASVVAVSHISAALHVVGSAGAALHMQGLGTPGQSHGGVLTVQGIAGGNAVTISQSIARWNVDHVTSVLHIQVAGAGIPGASLSVRCVNTGGTAFADCGGSGSGDAVNVFHQSTIRHVSSVTHVGGTVSLVGRDGTYVALTGTDLNVNCTGCSSSATVHISAALHVAGTINGARFHMQGVGSPGQSHGGVLTIQGITGANAVAVAQSVANWNIQHVSSAIHLAGGVTDNANSALRVTGVTVFTVMGAIDHIAGSLHIAGTINGAQLHIQGLGTPGASHGGVLTVQGITGMNALSISQSVARWNIDHVTSQVHVAGAIMIRDKLCASCVARVDHTGALVTSATVTVTTDNVNVFHQSTIRHISSVTHVVGYAGAALHVQGLGIPGGSHGGVLTIQGIAGMNAVAVSQSGEWNLRHVSSELHVAGAIMIRDKLCASCVARVDHTGALVTSATVTVTTDNINVFHQSTIRHISGSVHIAGTISGAQFHIQGLGTPGFSHGGVLTVQGIAGMNAIAVSQSGQWGVSSAQSGVWTIQAAHQGGEWNLRHATSVTHMVGSIRLMSGTPNNQLAVITHFGALAVTCYTAAGATETCGGTGGSGDAVNVFHQSTVRHVSSVTHIAGTVSLVNRAGTYVTVTGTALDVNLAAASVVAISHIASAVHVAGTIKGAQFHITGLGTPGQTHGGVFTIQGVTGMIAVDVTQSVSRWTVAHITSVTHMSGSVSLIARDGTYAALTGTSLNVAQGGTPWTTAHITSVTHIYGTTSLVNRAGIYASFTGTSLDVNVTSGAMNVAHVSSATHVVGTVTARSGFTIADVACHETAAIHQTASSQVIHGVGGFRVAICSVVVVSAHAQGLSLVAGQGTTCQTGQRPMIGGITTGTLRPSDSVVVAASGGFSSIAPSPWLLTPQTVDNVCLMQTGAGTLSGVITWRPVP